MLETCILSARSRHCHPRHQPNSLPWSESPKGRELLLGAVGAMKSPDPSAEDFIRRDGCSRVRVGRCRTALAGIGGGRAGRTELQPGP